MNVSHQKQYNYSQIVSLNYNIWQQTILLIGVETNNLFFESNNLLAEVNNKLVEANNNLAEANNIFVNAV